MTYEAQRVEICQVGKLLYDRGYVVSNDGNLSLRVAPDRLLVTPSGVGKGRMTPDHAGGNGPGGQCAGGGPASLL